ncbi:MAG: indole-3-glycerol-phosphate synthase [Candidatus Bathyarchaeia archaeon]|jgi:indole-3-glycerol phosphate synthase
MSDYLDVLAHVAQITIEGEYYENAKASESLHLSLRKAILQDQSNPVITEIKIASPSSGIIRKKVDAGEVARAMQRGGAVALSVLTEPKHFDGSLEALAEARKAVQIPILMKDIILSPVQLYAANKIGANAVLLIKALFDRGYCDRTLDEMIAGAHILGLEVLLETHTETEFQSAVKTDADFVGINNRDLATLKVDLNVTKKILEKNGSNGKPVVSESGIATPADILFLRGSGARAFLVGTAIMSASNIEEKVREFVIAK